MCTGGLKNELKLQFFSLVWQGSDGFSRERDYIELVCLLSKIFSETALTLLHSLYMETSPSSNNVMGHTCSLHQAFSDQTFEIWMSHSLHVSPLPTEPRVISSMGHDSSICDDISCLRENNGTCLQRVFSSGTFVIWMGHSRHVTLHPNFCKLSMEVPLI